MAESWVTGNMSMLEKVLMTLMHAGKGCGVAGVFPLIIKHLILLLPHFDFNETIYTWKSLITYMECVQLLVYKTLRFHSWR